MPHGNGKKPPAPVDERTAQNMRIAEKIGAETFEENTKILRRMAWRGGRAFLICGAGLAAFGYAMRQRRLVEAERRKREDDPAARYLEEMRGLGFDVDALEEELGSEQKARK